ncbi:hypothetical protein RIF29_36135 [Crotalaria pallida]|uniref:DUF7870 domain-containing protein n=1 Tax=Crotalaria pallida TaxID=3830 RepID=A0AAN9HUF4_CROPI
MKHLQHGSNSDSVLVIQIPDANVFSTVSMFLFLAMVLSMLLFLGSTVKGFSSNSHSVAFSGFESINAEALNLVLHDLKEEGLVKNDGKALIMSPTLNGFEGASPLNKEVDVVKDNLETKNSLPNESFDFVFMPNFEDAKFADRILKVNGIVAFPLGYPSSAHFRKPYDYKVVYVRRQHGSVIVALKKLGLANNLVDTSPKRKLLAAEAAKTVALKGLEDVLLEPPGKDLDKSKESLKIRYLPDLLGDHSLDGYKRRVFLGVGLPEETRAAIDWFHRNYPKKGTKFEIHSHKAAPQDSVVLHTDVSEWLRKHVKEEEYVVMKAEAEVVEDMIIKKATHLVDELFLECNNEWWQTGQRRKKSVRAYWECLALYGKLRDEGVAVHQWWG